MRQVYKQLSLLVCGLLISVAAKANGPSVIVAEVEERASVAPVHVNGEVRSRGDVLLPARAEGQVLWALEEGAQVKKGETIAQLDRLQLELRLKEQTLLAERADVNYAYLQGEVERLQALEKNNLAAKTQLAEMTSRRDLAQNDISVAKARIAQLEDSLERTSIVSPMDGMIVERMREQGEYARLGDTVVRVVDPGHLEIVAAIPVGNLNRIDFDGDVIVSLTELQFSALLRSIIQSGDQSSQTFDVIIDVPEHVAANMVAGQFVQVDVPLRSNKLLYVPRDAVVLRSEGNYVFRIVDQDDKLVAQRVQVELGEGLGDMVSIVSSEAELTTGDRIAIRGAESLQDGQEVTPVAS